MFQNCSNLVSVVVAVAVLEFILASFMFSSLVNGIIMILVAVAAVALLLLMRLLLLIMIMR